jgi:hypothetical protein
MVAVPEIEGNCVAVKVGWGATGGELAVRRMTNLVRRDLVASPLMRGEAWNN